MHPIHPLLVHFPIALLTASVIFVMLALGWRTGQLSGRQLFTLIGGVGGTLLSIISRNIEKNRCHSRFF